MNFYNPYLYSMPTSTTSNLFSKINFNSIINGTTKTLNLINQAIPVLKQVSPVVKNARTMFNIMNEFKKSDPITQQTNQNINQTSNYSDKNEITSKEIIVNNSPNFFI